MRHMDPVAFHIGSKPIYWYGVLVALGFLAAILHWTWRGKREGRPPGIGSDLAVWAMVGGVLGGRLAYVIANGGYFAAHPAEILRVDQGGLIFYGGFFGGCAAAGLFLRARKLPFWEFADFASSAVPLGHAFGRIGCFLNGCCYGRPTDAPWGVCVADAHRHPVPLYEAVLLAALYVALDAFARRRPVPGRGFALYLAGYGAIRLGLEFLRGDERRQWARLTVAQWISLALLASGIAIWRARRASRVPKDGSPSPA